MRLENDVVELQPAKVPGFGASASRARAVASSPVTWIALIVITSTTVRAALAFFDDRAVDPPGRDRVLRAREEPGERGASRDQGRGEPRMGTDLIRS